MENVKVSAKSSRQNFAYIFIEKSCVEYWKKKYVYCYITIVTVN